MFKTLGYLISTVSVVLLALVSWESAREKPFLFACLIGGMATSVAGMFLRWLAFKKEQAKVRRAERDARSARTSAATSPEPRGLTNDVHADANQMGAAT